LLDPERGVLHFMRTKKKIAWIRRKKGIRKNIFGSNEKPRLTVFRSSKHIYAQAINDEEGKTLVSLSTLSPEVKKEINYGGNVSAAEITGKLLSKRLKEKGIKQIAFDRNGFIFHGRIKTLADQIDLHKKKINVAHREET
jgi:large subunit ribosomal protein L18